MTQVVNEVEDLLHTPNERSPATAGDEGERAGHDGTMSEAVLTGNVRRVEVGAAAQHP